MANKPKGEFNKDPSPEWVRDTMIEDHKYRTQALGLDVSSTAIERMVQEDLRTFEAVKREQALDPKPAKKEPKKNRKKETVEGLAAEKGWEVKSKPVSLDPLLDRPAHKLDAKWSCAVARLKRILSPESLFRPSREMDYQGRELALSYIRMHLRFQHRTGEFRDLNDRDCRRCYRRFVEDLCDKSVGKFGPWWVK